MRYLQRGLTHRDADRATPGFTLLTPMRNAAAYLVNMAGDIVHQWELPAEPSAVMWQYQGNPSHTFDSFFISGCQRLWSGNTLICEGLWGRIFEATPAGDIVWEYINPFTGPQPAPGPSVGDVSFVFRAYRYAPDGPEIRGRLRGKLG